MWRPLTRALAVGIIAAIAIGACSAPTPGGYPPVAVLRAEPASTLAPPDAVVLSTVEREPVNNITGPEPGFYGHIGGSSLTSDQVFAFYSAALTNLGWKATSAPIRATTELRAWGWCKPRMLFRLANIDPRSYERVGLSGTERFAVVYDASISGASNDSCA